MHRIPIVVLIAACSVSACVSGPEKQRPEIAHAIDVSQPEKMCEALRTIVADADNDFRRLMTKRRDTSHSARALIPGSYLCLVKAGEYICKLKESAHVRDLTPSFKTYKQKIDTCLLEHPRTRGWSSIASLGQKTEWLWLKKIPAAKGFYAVKLDIDKNYGEHKTGYYALMLRVGRAK